VHREKATSEEAVGKILIGEWYRKGEALLPGLRGQGVQLADDNLGRSCTQGGKQISALPSYRAEARGTLMRREVVTSAA